MRVPSSTSGGNLGVNGALAQDSAFALALRAGIGNDASRALACGTSTSDAEETLLIPDLSAPLAGTAGSWTFSGGRTRTLTILASLVTADRDFLFHAEESFLKFERQVFAKIGAALHSAARRRPPPPNISPKPKNSPKMSLKSWNTLGSNPAPCEAALPSPAWP